MMLARRVHHSGALVALCCLVALLIVFNIGLRLGSIRNADIVEGQPPIDYEPNPIVTERYGHAPRPRNDFDKRVVENESPEGVRFWFLHKNRQPPAVRGPPLARAREDDAHMRAVTVAPITLRRTVYPPRVNMGACPKLFGRITVFVAVVESSYKTHYHVAIESLRCYLKSVDYEFRLVDLDHDERVNRLCKHQQLFFKKHCAASVYLNETDWMLVLDADAGVVNPNHCVEEWIDDRVDFIFYERFFNWEIASGNYLARNSEFARNFLMKWADWEFIQPKNWNGADNGVLQIHILQTLLPDAKEEIRACDEIWHRSTGYKTYMAYVMCVKVTLGAQRLYPGRLRVLRRGHGWVRDGYITGDGWSSQDFFLHGWKQQTIGATGWSSPFAHMFNVSDCESASYAGWNWRPEKRLSVNEVRRQFAAFERSVATKFPQEARIHPFLLEPDVGACYPHCDDAT